MGHIRLIGLMGKMGMMGRMGLMGLMGRMGRMGSYNRKNRKREAVLWATVSLVKKAASYSPALHCSTIGASGLNFSVRNGKRWDPAAITT